MPGRFLSACLCIPLLLPLKASAAEFAPAGVQKIVTAAIAPVMRQYSIPGMAVGLVLNGQSAFGQISLLNLGR
jgi:hypothetical protein